MSDSDKSDNPEPDDVPEPEESPEPNDAAEPEPGPEDWRALAALPLEQLERQMEERRRIGDRHSHAAWICLMQNIPRVRAFKESVGGDAFADRCQRLCRIGRTAANQIVSWGIAEPDVLTEIWNRVQAEAHAASIQGSPYQYPTLNKMLSWYKPAPELDDQAPSAEDARQAIDDLARGGTPTEEGSNDPRSKSELTRLNIMLEDQAKALTSKLTRLEQRLAEREYDYDRVSALATERQNDLAQLRNVIQEQKAQIEDMGYEILRLRAGINDPDPPPESPPDPLAEPETDNVVPLFGDATESESVTESVPEQESESEPNTEQPEAPQPMQHPDADSASQEYRALLTQIRDVPEPTDTELAEIEQRWKIKPFGGGNVKRYPRMMARLNRARAFSLLSLLPEQRQAEVAAVLLTLPFHIWLRDDIELKVVEDLLDMP